MSSSVPHPLIRSTRTMLGGSMRRAFLNVRLQPSLLASRGLLRSLNQLPIARSFATSSFESKPPSKWPTRLLIGGAALMGVKFLLTAPPEFKEKKRLDALGFESVKNVRRHLQFLSTEGDLKQAAEYFFLAFKAVEDVLKPQRKIREACGYANHCEVFNEQEAALRFYQVALKSLKELHPISTRCLEGMELMDRTAQYYHRAGQYESAEKVFKQAIRVYDKYHAEFSASASSSSNLKKLDSKFCMVLAHYAALLVSMERESEVPPLRQRFGELVRSSLPTPTGAIEKNLLDGFDDLMAFQSVRDERRRGHDRGDRNLTALVTRKKRDACMCLVLLTPHFATFENGMIRMLERRGLALPRRLVQRVPAVTAPTPIRALSSAARGGRSDGFYVSKKAVKTTLLLGAALSGGYLYLEREDADRKEIRLVLERSQLCLERGDFEQSMKEQEKAFELVKTKFPNDKDVIAMAMAIGASYEKSDQFEAAIPFYLEALQHMPLETRIVYREDLRVVMMDRLGQCYKQIGDSDAAEKYFKHAIEVYDQLKGQLSLAPESNNEPSVLSKLDEDVLNVFLHYSVLLTILKRPDDAARACRRLTTIARGSPQLRGQLAKIERQVDDYIALEKIRQERKLRELKGDDGADFV